METKIFICFAIFTLLYAFIETRHDVNVIFNDKGWCSFSRRWHNYGMIQNALTFLAPSLILCLVLKPYLAILLFLMNGALFWQLHDSLIGWRLYHAPFYLGDHGLDKWFRQVFWNGRTVAIIRIIFIGCCIEEYFRVAYGFYEIF